MCATHGKTPRIAFLPHDSRCMRSRLCNSYMNAFVHAVYTDKASAARAVSELVDQGFPSGDIGALMHNRQGEFEALPMKHKTSVPAGAMLGAAVGGLGGALILGGPALLAAGLFLPLLEGALAGGAFGTLAGTLGGLGLWREEIDFPNQAFDAGAVLIGVATHEGRAESAKIALQRAGAEQIHVSTLQGSTPPSEGDVAGKWRQAAR